MGYGLERFEIQLQKIESIIETAQDAPDKIHSLYASDLRTPFFMLEGLSRLYRRMHNPKRFEKFLLQSKQVEDLLGHYDFYLAIDSEIKGNSSYDKKLKQLVAEKIATAKEQLQSVLTERDWLNGQRIKKWRNQLDELKWMDETKESKTIKNVYAQEVNKVSHFMQLLPNKLEDMELQVHELRRKLRWLSIYCHALDNFTILEESPQDQPVPFEKYFTKEIINSPFNQLVADEKYKYPLKLNKESFLGLSWMIAHIGAKKDEGLHQEEFLILAENLELTPSETKKYETIKTNLQQSNQDILAACSDAIIEFRDFNILQDLMA